MFNFCVPRENLEKAVYSQVKEKKNQKTSSPCEHIQVCPEDAFPVLKSPPFSYSMRARELFNNFC